MSLFASLIRYSSSLVATPPVAEETPSEEAKQADEMKEDEEEEGRATLSSLLSQALPDGEAEAPQIVVVGSQSSGKSYLIICMVLYFLLQDEQFDDAVGKAILRICRTGTGEVTKRPVKISLQPAGQSDSPCSLTISLGNQKADHASPDFERILSEVENGTVNYHEPLLVHITSSNLPRINFLDLPGIVAGDMQSDGNSDKPVCSYVASLARDPRNVLLLVENASVATTTLDNSSSIQILKWVEKDQPSVFSKSILVLTKWDLVSSKTVKDFRQTLAKWREGNAKYPFRAFIPVANKTTEDTPEPNDFESFKKFRDHFEKIRSYEEEKFGREMELSSSSQPAPRNSFGRQFLFQVCDGIVLDWHKANFHSICYTLRRKIAQQFQEWFISSSPPRELYLQNDLQAMYSIRVLFEEFQSHCHAISQSVLEAWFLDHCVSLPNLAAASHSPDAPSSYGALSNSGSQRDFYRTLERKLHEWAESLTKEVEKMAGSVKDEWQANSMHGIARFDVLCECFLSHLFPPEPVLFVHKLDGVVQHFLQRWRLDGRLRDGRSLESWKLDEDKDLRHVLHCFIQEAYWELLDRMEDLHRQVDSFSDEEKKEVLELRESSTHGSARDDDIDSDSPLPMDDGMDTSFPNQVPKALQRLIRQYECVRRCLDMSSIPTTSLQDLRGTLASARREHVVPSLPKQIDPNISFAQRFFPSWKKEDVEERKEVTWQEWIEEVWKARARERDVSRLLAMETRPAISTPARSLPVSSQQSALSPIASMEPSDRMEDSHEYYNEDQDSFGSCTTETPAAKEETALRSNKRKSEGLEMESPKRHLQSFTPELSQGGSGGGGGGASARAWGETPEADAMDSSPGFDSISSRLRDFARKFSIPIRSQASAAVATSSRATLTPTRTSSSNHAARSPLEDVIDLSD